MTRVPMFSDIGGDFTSLNPDLFQHYQLVQLGESAKRIPERWGISRQEAD